MPSVNFEYEFDEVGGLMLSVEADIEPGEAAVINHTNPELASPGCSAQVTDLTAVTADEEEMEVDVERLAVASRNPLTGASSWRSLKDVLEEMALDKYYEEGGA